MIQLPENFIDTSEMEITAFSDIREITKLVIEKIAPNASVYPFWELEFDPNTLLRKVSPLLKGKPDSADANHYHAWMCGIESASIRGGEGGDQSTEFVGSYAFTFDLTLEIEGFFDINGSDPYKVAEDEYQKLAIILHRNQDRLLDFAHFGKLEMTGLDKEAFADSKNMIVLSASSIVTAEVTITI